MIVEGSETELNPETNLTCNERRVPQLRVPGALWLRLADRAEQVAARNDPYELDLADAVSKAKVVKRGGGHQARIQVDPDQIDRLAMWVKPNEREAFYRAADALRAQMEADADA